MTWTDAHADFARAEIVQQIFTNFSDDKSPLYEPEVASLLGKKAKKKKVGGEELVVTHPLKPPW